MVSHVFPDPTVKKLLSQFVLIRADVTNNTEDEIALTKHFHVIAPPTFLFFDKEGYELQLRIVGEVDIKEFTKNLQKILVSVESTV